MRDVCEESFVFGVFGDVDFECFMLLDKGCEGSIDVLGVDVYIVGWVFSDILSC